MSTGCIKKLLVETVAYIFTDIPFMYNQSPYFFKKCLKVATNKAPEKIPKYGRIEAQSWPLGNG